MHIVKDYVALKLLIYCYLPFQPIREEEAIILTPQHSRHLHATKHVQNSACKGCEYGAQPLVTTNKRKWLPHPSHHFL